MGVFILFIVELPIDVRETIKKTNNRQWKYNVMTRVMYIRAVSKIVAAAERAERSLLSDDLVFRCVSMLDATYEKWQR